MSFFKRKTSDTHSSAVTAHGQKENSQNAGAGGRPGPGGPGSVEAPGGMEIVAGSGYAKGRSGMGAGIIPQE